jgi:two-component system sensor histidine kinase/response regulator
VASLARMLVWQQARGAPLPELRFRALRMASSAVALAWGIGAGLLMPHLAPEYEALLLLAIGGLAAGASGTLTSDKPSFILFCACLLGPLPIVLVSEGLDRFHMACAIFTGLFAMFVLVLHRRGHMEMLAERRAAASLAATNLASRREHVFLDALFASVPEAIVITDRTGTCLGVNPYFERMFNYAASEALGRPLQDLIIPAESRDAAEVIVRRVLAGETVLVEGNRQRRDGTLVPIRLSAAPIAGDEAGRILLMYSDMTATRRAEDAVRAVQSRLELVLASSPAIIYTTRLEGEHFVGTWASENLKRITGWEVSETMRPQWWYENVHPDDRERAIGNMPHLIETGSLSMEYRIAWKDGTFRWVRDESRLIRDAEGRPLEVFGAWLDITDLKVAEDRMRESSELAERSARVRTEFLANMSHEIRTPMNAVLGLTELLLDSDLAPEQRRSLQLVQSAGETLLVLLNDVLDLSKIEAEHVALEAIPFDVRYVLDSTIGLFAVRTGSRPVELIADVAPDIPDQVVGDPTRLRQVLNNLVGNALKFTERGEVVVSAGRESQADGSMRLRFSVRDTGIGIAADQLESIFEKFTQADASTTRKYGGTGLGLTIARRLVELMGSTLTVTSEPGRGSEFAFSISLPVDAVRAAPPREATPHAGQRMLIVDDNAINRRIVREALGRVGAVVDEASTAADGMLALCRARDEARPYAVAIIDARMPDRDGFDLAQAIRAEPDLAPGMRLLMLTSTGQLGDTQRCREIGIEAYLMKPVSRSDLIEATAVLLGGARAPADQGTVTRHSLAEARPRVRVLLAEDNAVNQEVAATMLRKRGHSVTIVGDGRAAVEAVATGGPFDVVLMDIQMPELDGVAATQQIRQGGHAPGVRIIALTAHALGGERERYLAAGMNGYLAKPFRPHELFAVVEEGTLAAPPVVPVPTAEPVSAPASVVPAAAPRTEHVDLAGFRQTMREAGAEEAVDAILDVFAESAPERLADLSQAVATGDARAIERSAHAFRSPAGSIGARHLASLLHEMEAAAIAGESQRARETFSRVSPEADAVLNYLRVYRNKEFVS